jgi:serine/threonine protein kinase
MESPIENDLIGYGYRFADCNVENPDRYCPGGFHPVVLGDTLGPEGRYEVLHKLGHGGYGTVWFCRDSVLKKWKAVKVLAASESGPDNNDLKVLRMLDGASREELEKRHICLSESYFYEDGPNGKHLCLVLPVLGEPITGAWDDFGGNRPDILKDLCAQMCEAMQFLHERNVCHGDFRPQNILYKIPGIEDMTEDEIYDAGLLPAELDVIELGPVPATGEEPPVNLPGYLLPSGPLMLPSELMSNEIMVVDFGEAYEAFSPPAEAGIPLEYAAPECVLKCQSTGFGADVWSLAACFCKIRQGDTPFDDNLVCGYVERLEDILGPLPEPYRSAWFENGHAFGEPLLSTDEPVSMTTEEAENMKARRYEWKRYRDFLERFVYDKTQFARMDPDGGPGDDGDGLIWYEWQTPADEAALLLDLVRKVLKYDASERLSVNEIMEHDWFAGIFTPIGGGKGEQDDCEMEEDDSEDQVFYDAEEYLFYDAVEFQEPDEPMPEYRAIHWSNYWYVTML